MQKTSKTDAFSDPHEAAAFAGLHYRADDTPGIVRRKCGKGFIYLHPNGTRVRDAATRARIRALAIPPAWTDVWISPDPSGHLAATGFDARRRKQYRYNAEFVAARDSAKYEHLVDFACRLPTLRRRVRRDMMKSGIPRDKIVATIVYLLERTLSRVGNERYAKQNNSFGLTTLHNRHVQVNGSELRFDFKGKAGKVWRLRIDNPRVAKVVRACQELPGQNLFEYQDSEGNIQRVGSSDVNLYLNRFGGHGITAKDFRTWWGTVEVALALDANRTEQKAPVKKHLKAAIAKAARRLGNTVAVCRKCYVHPAVIEAYESGTFVLPARKQARSGLSMAETRVLAFLERQLKEQTKRKSGAW